MLRKVKIALIYSGIVLFSGIASGISFDFPSLCFLIWFSFIPLFSLLKFSFKGVFLGFFLAGFIFYLTSIFWIGFVTKIGLFALCGYLALYWGLFGLGAKYLTQQKKVYFLAALPLLWVILEIIREKLFGGFGWAILGYSQFRNFWVNQTASLLGVKFISYLIILANAFLYSLLKKQRIKIKGFVLTAGLVVFAIVYSYFYARWPQSAGKSFSVNIIQTNISQEQKWMIPPRRVLAFYGKLIEKSDKNSLVIFPEASWPKIIKEDKAGELANFARKYKRAILMGAVSEQKGKFFNSAFLIDKNGAVASIYRKIKLVPFGEYVPLRKYLRFIKAINYLGDMSAGEILRPLNFRGHKLGVVICFEDAFPYLCSRLKKKKAQCLINITNDAWFLGEPEATQHLGILAFRAIENGIPAVRAANTGISGIIDNKGKVIARLRRGRKDVFVSGILKAKVRLKNRHACYPYAGDIFLLFLGLAFLFI